MIKKIFKVLALLVVLSLISCGGGDDDNKGGRFDFSSNIKIWQSYSATPFHGTNYWNGKSQVYVIKKIDRFNDDFRSGYGFINDSDNDLIFLNLASGETFNYKNGVYKEIFYGSSSFFQNDEHYFFMQDATIKACSKSEPDFCVGIEVMEGTFPYVFAESNQIVLAVTNWGDAVKFDGMSWCRMTRDFKDTFICDNQEPMVTKPRGIQFYSSIKYQGKTLVGEWPTGSIYAFDGDTLQPSEKWTPPTLRARERIGYEAQSMAEYCGDLFVGYWPKGEIWRFSRELNQWVYFKRFFSESRGDKTFIPWSNRDADQLDSSFFGQRITALIPFEKSLFVTTSNLSSWHAGIFIQDFLTSDELDEYGAIYEIKGKDCLTVYGSTK